MTPLVELRGVSKTFGEGRSAFHALRGVDFCVSPGEMVMLRGPSGSGKTTLLSIVGCVLRASGGTVRLFGHEVGRRSDDVLAALRLEQIGFIFQAHNLIASLCVQDNVQLVLEMRGHPRREAARRALAMLDAVNLRDKAESMPRDLSGGQRQRVAIARALVGEPPLILADEPTAALDAQNGLAVTTLLRELAKRSGRTVVVVTHDNRIVHLADRLVTIEDGRIVQEARG